MAVFLTGRNPIRRLVPKSETKTIEFYPADYDEASSVCASISDATTPVGKGSDNTTYAQISLTTGSGAETSAFFLFDLSSVPAGATIDSVACTAKGSVSSTSTLYISSRTMQLFSGDTAKGDAVSLTTTATAHELTGGTWSRDELDTCKLRLYAKRGSLGSSTARTMNFYGATLTVSYTYFYEEVVYE